MLQNTIVLCTVLALSSALPHHFWTWSHPDSVHRVYGEKDTVASVQDATVNVKDVCKSVIGEIDNNGASIRRSYHLCTQENPEPGLENVVACFYTTATCCINTGLLVDSATVSVNGGTDVTVKYYSINGQTDLCYSTDADIPPCVPGINCIPQCTVTDPVCLNQTLAGDETSCTNLVCKCKKGFAPPDCCHCDRGYSRVNDKCEPLCLKNCQRPDLRGGCLECRLGYTPLPDCCNCDDGFYGRDDGTCEPPCEDNIGSCQDGVCTCKVGFGGPDCCQCRKNSVRCTDTACECQEGYVAPTCCECSPGYYRSTDGTCQPPCRDNIVSCENEECTCKAGFGGPDCCQCRKNSVSCTDTACVCHEGYAAPTCCKCSPGYYRAADGTCQPPCRDNIISCQNDVCTCKAGFGGLGCCLCRKNAISCSDDSCECQEGYAAPNCCLCDDNFYKTTDGTCESNQ